MKQGQFPEIIKLGDLNGQNGFKLDSENNGDRSGTSVGMAGDINSDGYADLIIGAPYYPSTKGRSYVVFGGPGVGSSGTVSLSSLNGVNGFKLYGENNQDYSGSSVSAAGDINDDGHDDLIIGAYGYLSFTGRSYVVFGGSGVGSSGIVNLSGLNGNNGFKLDGENNQDQSGCSVSAAGDINGDGHDDLIIGAETYTGGSYNGRSYVVFGGPMINNTGLFNLSNLNGINGFKLMGETTVSASGFSVGMAGDINGDEHNDLIIGAWRYVGNSRKGRSYVVFGAPGVGGSGSIALSNLNGTNGFALDGENNGDNSGWSVSTAGDINGDGYVDLIIGASGYPESNYNGRGYVIFGRLGISGNGVFSLGSLDGSNGFKLDGENNNDYCTYSVSAAGDINGDGYDDFIAGAYGYPGGNATGRSYVMFGGLGVGKTGLFSLSSLNGSNGFKLDGENNNDYSGYSVNAAGDINGDGCADLVIGAKGYSNSRGRSYVVFGDVPPVLVNNSLGVYSGERIILDSRYLVAYDRNHDNNTLLFIPSEVYHGYFAQVNSSEQAISNFTQQQITNGSIQFVHDGGPEAPSYSITVRSAGIAWTGPDPANITFGNFIVLKTNQLVINQGQTLILAQNNLHAAYSNDVESNFDFWVTNLEHGYFEWISVPGKPILTFQQQNITDRVVCFVHDNSSHAPAYQITVTDGQSSTIPQSALIDFDANPVLMNNTLRLNQGETILLTSDMLSATHPGGNDCVLLFNVTKVQQGEFNLNLFYQQNITNGLIQFTHDNSLNAPAYYVSVSDGRITLPPESAVIDFDTLPILLNNSLRINQGQNIIFSSDNLRATQPFKNDSALIFVFTAVQHGNFSLIDSTDQPIFSVQQSEVTAGMLQFTHDNTAESPAYLVAVTDGRASTQSQSAVIDFDASPILLNNQLRIGQGQTVNLTSENLSASHSGTEDSDLNFIISTVEHGIFLIGQQSATIFSQQTIKDDQVSFIHDNSLNSPEYTVSVSDGRITTTPAVSVIQFDVKPILKNNQLFLSRGQKLNLTTDNLLATHNGAESDDLQFLISAVRQGQFEKISQPGVKVDNFIQKDLVQQQIVFVHDNSTQAPDYQVTVFDGWMESEVMSGITLLAMTQPWPVNQGESFNLSTDFLNVISDNLTPGQIQFTVSDVQQAQFESIDNPGFALPSFSQQQVTSGKIILAPDGTLNSPQCHLIVNSQDHLYGTLACPVDFDAPPVLNNAYLQTSPNIRVAITQLNLKASTPTRSAEALIFEISELTQGYFANNDNWKIPLFNFSQQDITNNQILFVTDDSGKSPHFKVSVWDGRLHCQPCPQSADVIFQGSGSSDQSISELVKNSLMGALISGGVGLLFFVLKWYLNYKHVLHLQRGARPTIDGEAQELYADALLLPIAREVFSRIKIGGCLGYIGQDKYNEYIGAVTLIVGSLETLDIIHPDHWQTLPRPQKQRIIEAIATQTKQIVGNNRCCSTRTFTSFYKAEVTPKMIRDKANAIADAVRDSLSEEKEIKKPRSFSLWNSDRGNVLNQNPSSDLSLQMMD